MDSIHHPKLAIGISYPSIPILPKFHCFLWQSHICTFVSLFKISFLACSYCQILLLWYFSKVPFYFITFLHPYQWEQGGKIHILSQGDKILLQNIYRNNSFFGCDRVVSLLCDQHPRLCSI